MKVMRRQEGGEENQIFWLAADWLMNWLLIGCHHQGKVQKAPKTPPLAGEGQQTSNVVR